MFPANPTQWIDADGDGIVTTILAMKCSIQYVFLKVVMHSPQKCLSTKIETEMDMVTIPMDSLLIVALTKQDPQIRW